LPSGSHIIIAVYLGDEEHDEAESDPLTQVVDYVPSIKVYYITATSDIGSKISPKGTVTVDRGQQKKFSFSPLEGHSISAVLVNGKPLSQERIDLGYYIFRDVKANHTIEVISVINYTLTINVIGNGYAEFSIDGSPFTEYTDPVSIKLNSALILRAYAGDGYEFKEWRTGLTVFTESEISFESVTSDKQLDLSFEEERSGTNISWWVVGLVLIAAIFVIAIVLLLRKKT
jgi:hypothetical protein